MIHFALRALGPKRYTGLAAVPNHGMRKLRPIFFWEQFHQILFDVIGVCVTGQPEPLGDPLHMGIDDDSRDAEGGSEDHIGCLAADSGKLDQLFHRLGDPALMFFNQLFGAGDDAFGLVLIEAGGMDFLFECLGVGFCVVLRGVVFLEEPFGDQIHPFIRALGRKDSGDQKLEGFAVV